MHGISAHGRLMTLALMQGHSRSAKSKIQC